MLYPSKTELLWIISPRRNHQISCMMFSIGDIDIVPSTESRFLGVLDDSLSFIGHQNIVTGVCFFQLWRIREIHLYFSTMAAIHFM